MVTKVKFVGTIYCNYKKLYIFRLISRDGMLPNRIYVENVENGIVTLEVPVKYTLSEMANIVSGCFDENSNFEKELRSNYNECNVFSFSKIKVVFREIAICVTKENSDVSIIQNEYTTKLMEQISSNKND